MTPQQCALLRFAPHAARKTTTTLSVSASLSSKIKIKAKREKTMRKYQLICKLLAVLLLVNACTVHTPQAQPPTCNNNALSPFSVGLGPYSNEATSSTTSSSTPSSSESTFGKIVGGLLALLLVGAAIKASSDYGGGTSNMTEIEKQAGRHLTKSEYEQYYDEHPEAWTPVYVLPSK